MVATILFKNAKPYDGYVPLTATRSTNSNERRVSRCAKEVASSGTAETAEVGPPSKLMITYQFCVVLALGE